MAGRDIQIPFGPDKTNGAGFAPIDTVEVAEEAARAAEPAVAEPAVAEQPDLATQAPAEGLAPEASEAPEARATSEASARPRATAAPEPEAGGLSAEEAASQGMDEFQMSILALKDSIGQGRELKEREKEREELAQALEADHIELADRENILANFDTLAAEQDEFIAQHTQQREARKEELSQVTVAYERAQGELDALRERHAVELQPIEEDLGRARAAADQAKNDERSRKSELNAAESEVRRADESDASNMALAQMQQVEAAYNEARARSEQAKEQLAQVQKVYDDAKQRAEQAQGPLERSVEDLTRHSEELKQEINRLGEEISSAHNRRQYLDTVHQYPDETAKMRAEVEMAESTARKMDAENEALRQQLAESKRKAKSAKLAIGILIAVIIVAIIAFVVVSGR